MADQSLDNLHDQSNQVLSPHQPNRGFLHKIGRYSQQHQTNLSLDPELPKPDLPKTQWKLTEKLQEQFKKEIFPQINNELQLFFDSDRKGELVTIDAYMMGKSQAKAKPTILLVGGDSKTREGAKKAIKTSRILDSYSNWQVAHTTEFPRLPETYNESSVLNDFEFWSSNGKAEWLDERNRPSLATEVYLDPRLYSDPSKPVSSMGLAIYIKHPSGLRPATANIIQLDNRLFLQTVYHAFHSGEYMKKSTGPSDLPALPSIETLAIVGRLLVWSVDRDWALIEVVSEEMKSRMSNTLAEDREHWLFQRAERPYSAETIAYTCKGASRVYQVVLSETTTYMKLPNSSSFQEVHQARLLGGSWSNGDCGAVVYEPNSKSTFGHVLGGSRAKGVALIIAADHVVEDFQELNLSSHLRGDISIDRGARTLNIIADSTDVETSNITDLSPSQPPETQPQMQELLPENPSVGRNPSSAVVRTRPSIGFEAQSDVWNDPNPIKVTAKYDKGDIVNMSLVESGIRYKGTFTVRKARLHSSGAFVEYSLYDSNKELYLKGAYIRENKLTLEQRHK